MSDLSGTCDYVLDPDDPETWDGEQGDVCYVDDELLNEEGVWTCPHSAEDGDLCIFHLPVDEKDDAEVVDAFLKVFEERSDGAATQERNSQFLNARFGEFDLSEYPSEIALSDGHLTMNHATITGPLDWSELVVSVPAIDLREIECGSTSKFTGTTFDGQTSFSGAEFDGGVSFDRAQFDDDVSFERGTFRGRTTFNLTEFHSESSFEFAEFLQRVSFERTDFGREANFYAATFEGTTLFTKVTFEGYTNFGSTEFRDDASFEGAEFKDNSFFVHAEFWGTTLFNEAAKAEFDESADFRSAEFRETVNFSEVGLAESQFDGADLTDATFSGADLLNTSFESALLSRATLFEADLRGAKLNGAVLGDVRIDEATRFLGHPSDDSDTSPHTLSAIRSRPTCVYDPDYESDNEDADIDKAKSVYRALEELGGKHARPRLQARSFVRRQDLQKIDYRDGATAADAGIEERVIAGARWSRAKAARATLLYGESPWRVIAWSLGIILSFALLYPLGGWMKPTDGDPITYTQIASNPAEILNSVYYSTLTYTAFGFGDFQPVGLGRLLITLETGLGAVMLALLVFILGRRAAR